MLERLGYFLSILVLVASSVAVWIGVPLRLLGADFSTSLIPALVVMVIGGLGAWAFVWRAPRIVHKFLNPRIMDPRGRSLEERELYDMIARNARAAGLVVVPAVAVYSSPDANLFSVASGRGRALLVISEALRGPALETAVYRELLRIARGDTATMTLLAGLQGVLVWPFVRAAAALAGVCFPGERGATAPEFSAYHLTAFILELVFFSLAAFPLTLVSRAMQRTADRRVAAHVKSVEMARLVAVLKEQGDIPTPRDEWMLLRLRSDRRLLFWSTHPARSERDRYTHPA